MTAFHPLLAIIGPTASGKSALALSLAERIGAQILNVDSMQVYRGMDIGTAKPSAAEQALVKHHLIDIVEPDQTFTVARFVQLADQAIASDVPLIAVGGTPLYFKALFEGMFEGPGEDLELRKSLGNESGEELHKRLAAIDPAAALRIHANDTRRMIRALEVHHLTGQSITSLQSQWGGAVRHKAIWIGLQWEKEAINHRINARVKQMIEAGWVEEARRLPPLSKTAGEATGYRVLKDHLEGKISLRDAIEQIKIATRQLARRQMKWFRRFANVTWMNGAVDNVERCVELARATQDGSTSSNI